MLEIIKRRSIIFFIVLSILSSLFTFSIAFAEEDNDFSLLENLNIVDDKLIQSPTVSSEMFLDYAKKLTGNIFVNISIPVSDSVSFGQAVEFIVKLAGYENDVKQNGSVWVVAGSIGLLKGIEQNNDKISGLTLAKLFNNTMEIYINELTSISNGKYTYNNNTYLFMEKYHQLYKKKGKIIAVKNHSLYEKTIAEDNVLIEYDNKEEIFQTECDFTYEDLGLHGYVYYRARDDGSKTVVFMDKSDSKYIRIDSKNITALKGDVVSGFQIEYESDKRTKKIKIEPLADYVYNTVADCLVNGLIVDKQLLMNNCTELVLEDCGDGVETVFINNYTTAIVDSISISHGLILDKSSQNNLSFDADSDNCIIDVYRDNEISKLSKIKIGDTLSVLRAKTINNEDYLRIYASSKTVSGSVWITGDDYVSIYSETFDKSESFKTIEQLGKKIVAGTYITAYINIFGQVAYFEKDSNSEYYYGYVIRCTVSDEGSDDIGYLKIFDQYGKWNNYKLFDKVQTNSGRVDAKKLLSDSIYGFVDNLGNDIAQLVKYKLNYRGEILAIYVAIPDDEYFSRGKTISKSAYVPSVSGLLDVSSEASRVNRLHYCSSTIVFAVPGIEQKNSSNYESQFKIYSPSYFDEKALQVTGYDADEFFQSKVLVCETTDTIAPNPGGSVIYVDNVSKSYDNRTDSVAIRINYLKNNQEEYFEIDENNKCYDYASGIEKNDIIRVSSTGSTVDGIEKIISAKEDITQKAPVIDAKAFNSDYAPIFGKVQKIDFKAGLVLIGEDNNPFLFNIKAVSKIVLADEANDAVLSGTINDIAPHDYIFIRYAWKEAKEVIVIRKD